MHGVAKLLNREREEERKREEKREGRERRKRGKRVSRRGKEVRKRKSGADEEKEGKNRGGKEGQGVRYYEGRVALWMVEGGEGLMEVELGRQKNGQGMG